MIKLKKILESIEHLPPREFTMGPDGDFVDLYKNENDCYYHGDVILKVPKYMKFADEAIKTGLYKNVDEINEDAKKGSVKLYRFLFQNGFIRGFYKILYKELWLNFIELTERQKDSLLNLLLLNKDDIKDIKIDIFKENKLRSFDNISIKDFIDIYL